MGIKTYHFAIRVGHPDRDPTEEEALSVIGTDRWDNARNGARPQSGAYLVGYRTDLGRRGDERDARGAAHVDDTGFRGRPAGEREPPRDGGGRG
jgi:hypothetical protein